jgi:anti-sigma regulatory factor (Ser/Thr protein kinase)
MADDVILCTSELAANATLHSHSRLPGGTFTVRAKISPGDYAWIEVEDDGGPTSPGIRDSAGHHGLDIVRALATNWGIGGDETTRTIWARFDWPDRP